MALTTPVALFLFNRPLTTARVLEAIAKAHPTRLFLIADGPRRDHPTDAQRCVQAQQVVQELPWSCLVRRNYATSNLGLPLRVVTGLNWVFTQVDECIILEDDCLPSPSFFRFCAEMLERYRHEPRIWQVNGYRWLPGPSPTEDSYYVSRNTCPWGWATWRRAWQHYDVRCAAWGERRQTRWLEQLIAHPRAARYFRQQFDKAWRGEARQWSAQWTFACWLHGGLTIAPAVDLVQNLGFGEDATHTMHTNPRFQEPLGELEWPLRHPATLERNRVAEAQWSALVAAEVMQREWQAPSQKLYAALPGWGQAVLRGMSPGWLRRWLRRHWTGHQEGKRKQFAAANLHNLHDTGKETEKSMHRM
jgi:hypothetical protein